MPFRPDAPVEPQHLHPRLFQRRRRADGFDKVVYGEIELSHRYEYHGNGVLRRAEIVMLDEEPAVVNFDEAGERVSEAMIMHANDNGSVS